MKMHKKLRDSGWDWLVECICEFTIYLMCVIEESCFIDDIYPVRYPFPCLILTFNIFLPGVGTMIQACQFRLGFKCSTFLLGWLQLITFPLLFGWVWAIYHAVLVERKTKEYY